MICLPYAVVKPFAMMIKLITASIALSTMFAGTLNIKIANLTFEFVILSINFKLIWVIL